MGRHANTEPRTFVGARTKDGRTVYQSGIRREYNQRHFLGTYPTREQAQAAADHYLQHGTLDPETFGAIHVGRPRKHPAERAKRKPSPSRPKPKKPAAAPEPPKARLDYHARGELLRRLYRAIY